MRNLLLNVVLISFFLSPAFGADQNVDMLNKSGKEINVYSKKIVNVDVGDTVFWKSVNPGHNVEFFMSGIGFLFTGIAFPIIVYVSFTILWFLNSLFLGILSLARRK